MMQKIIASAFIVARASGWNPFLSVLTVYLFYIGFAVVESSIERLIWGESFEHILDPIFALAFMSHAALCVYICAKQGGNQ